MQSAVAVSSYDRKNDKQDDAPIYRPAVEELNSVTLQVVMIGRDGIVLASDTAEVEYPANDAGVQTRARTDVLKITSLPKRRVTYAPAGDEVAVEVGEQLKRELESTEGVVTKEWLERVASEVYTNAKKRFKKEHRAWEEGTRRTLLVVCYGEKPMVVWRLRILPTPQAIEIRGQAIAGDVANPARFLVEQYYSQELRVPALKRLAAFFICMGSARNTALVGPGMEMRVFTEASETLVSPGELSELRRDPKELDDLIRSHLASGSGVQNGSTI